VSGTTISAPIRCATSRKPPTCVLVFLNSAIAASPLKGLNDSSGVGTGENVFVARHGKLISPPLSAGALEGITQSTVMAIARDLGFDVELGDLSRSDLYIAEEMFVCGTAAEVSSVLSVDDRELPCPGPMTLAIGEEYGRVVRGQVDRYKDWVEHVH